MDSSDYAELAQKLGPQAFLEQFGGTLFLVKRKRDRSWPAAPSDGGPPISYRTTSVRATAELIDTHDVLGRDLRVWPVRKKPGNPYPDRVSVGRAINCDIVLRAPYLSKLHAHFIRNPAGGWTLTDNDSANGTRVNSCALTSGTAAHVGPGDRVSFGGLELELADAAALYEMVLG